MNLHELDDHPTAVEDVLGELDPPDDAVARLVAASLATEPARRAGPNPVARSLLLLLLALALLVIPAVLLLRSSAPEPAGGFRTQSAPAEGPGFSLSNREGLLVLRSPTGQYLAVSGGRDD